MDIGKHPILMQAHEVCLAIEKCGASTELTEAVTKASDLMCDIEKFVDVARHAKALLDTMNASEPPDAHYWVEGTWNAEPSYRLRQAIAVVFPPNAALSSGPIKD